MDAPRLRIEGEEIGLRHIGDKVYEPKSIKVLQRALYGIPQPDACKFFTESRFPSSEPLTYHKIESFCFVTTDNIKREAAMLLKSLRKFHDQPIYILCDNRSKRFLVKEGLKDDNVFFILNAEKENLDKIKKEIFTDHKCIANNVHKPAEIFLKMEVMETVLRSHNNTFFLDSDIIVLDNLQEYFQAKVVLSPHYYPTEFMSHGFESGFYNAGYIFCASKGFPKFWRHLYLNDSIFFEQECMNRIPNHCNIQTFGRDHNVGFWRRGQMPQNIKSLHFHITEGADKNRCESLKKLNLDIKSFGVDLMKEEYPDLYNYYIKITSPKKIAFVHFGKAAGVYVDSYIRQTCCRLHENFLSWHRDSNPYGISNRDWKKDELMKIAETEDECAYVTNHHINWDLEIIKKYKEKGWFIFTFLRRPEEVLCSLFNWGKENDIITRPQDLEPVNLEECFKFALDDNDNYKKLWQLPEYIDELDYVAEFNDKNFSEFLLNNFGEIYKPGSPSNTSSNKGFIYYRENGDISDRVAWQLLKHPEYERYLTYL